MGVVVGVEVERVATGVDAVARRSVGVGAGGVVGEACPASGRRCGGGGAPRLEVLKQGQLCGHADGVYRDGARDVGVATESGDAEEVVHIAVEASDVHGSRGGGAKVDPSGVAALAIGHLPAGLVVAGSPLDAYVVIADAVNNDGGSSTGPCGSTARGQEGDRGTIGADSAITRGIVAGGPR